MKSLLDIEVTNNVYLIRVDLNCPYLDGKIKDYTRIKTHSKTIKHIAEHKGKAVVIAHQGRPGSTDFHNLQQHTEILQMILGSSFKVEFCPYTHGSEVEKSIRKMNAGDILVLENVRMVETEMNNKSAEEHAQEPYIQSLAKVGDIFVNDAFSAAHRSHGSLVGFTTLLPSVAGLIMEQEVTNLQRVVKNPKKPCVFILGGIKPDDSFNIADYVLERNIANTVLTGGTVSQLILVAKGKSLGEPVIDFLKKKELINFIDIAKVLQDKFQDQIKVQTDFAVDEGGRKIYSLEDLPLNAPILDIGDQTIEDYTEIVEQASTVVLNGPMGKFEESGFEKGTLEIIKAMERSKGFSLAGGGHSVSIIEQHNIQLSYVSTAGKALLQFLMGKILPAIEALDE
jgi:phosphoglycerate kinase